MATGPHILSIHGLELAVFSGLASVAYSAHTHIGKGIHNPGHHHNDTYYIRIHCHNIGIEFKQK